MTKKLGYGKREETSKIHQKIVNEFEEMKIKNNGKNIKISLDFLAKKYGYSCGQAVRNMINNFHKKTKDMKYRKFQFAKRFNILEKEVNKMAYFKRSRMKPTSAQMERYNRAKRLLNVMNKRYPIIVTKIEQNVSLKVITDNLKYSLD